MAAFLTGLRDVYCTGKEQYPKGTRHGMARQGESRSGPASSIKALMFDLEAGGAGAEMGAALLIA